MHLDAFTTYLLGFNRDSVRFCSTCSQSAENGGCEPEPRASPILLVGRSGRRIGRGNCSSFNQEDGAVSHLGLQTHRLGVQELACRGFLSFKRMFLLSRTPAKSHTSSMLPWKGEILSRGVRSSNYRWSLPYDTMECRGLHVKGLPLNTAQQTTKAVSKRATRRLTSPPSSTANRQANSFGL